MTTNIKAIQLKPLGAREREIAQMVARGMTDQAIADELNIGKTTVVTTLTKVYSKLSLGRGTGVNSRVLLARWVWDGEVTA